MGPALPAAERDARGEVESLCRRALGLRPLLDVLASPIRLGLAGTDRPGDADALQRLLDRVTVRLHAPALAVDDRVDPGALSAFERVLETALDGSRSIAVARAVDAGSDPGVERIADEVAATGFDRYRAPDVETVDGARLRAYAAGRHSAAAVVIASACGMPAKLCEPWMVALARRHLVLTWETRGLFGDGGELGEFDALEHDAFVQAKDLFAVLDAQGVESAHVMGFCTGAVIALAAAALQPDRVSSLSLWHGSYELGPAVPKSVHQRNMQEVMALAGESRPAASSLHTMLCQSMLKTAPAELSHLILYPYATPEILYRYSRVNGSVVGTDLEQLLATVVQPTLVVTSEDDETAHPTASREVAGRLADATLHVAASGDHISIFKAGERIERVAEEFLGPTRAGAWAS